MVVWGGGVLNTGGRYDPATDTWTATSTAGAPSGRARHTAVWTGSVMVVWGGGVLNTGGRYDRRRTSGRQHRLWGAFRACNHTAVWTGSRMVVWGGNYLNTGGRYDPVTDTWTATSTVGAPSARSNHTAVWTGSRMVVWGGSDSGDTRLNTGGRYDPVTDTWTATMTLGAPSARYDHTAVWTGSTMVVWGGWGGSYLNTGGRYDPATDTWTATSTAGAPSGRARHTAVWTEARWWSGAAGAAATSTPAAVRSGDRHLDGDVDCGGSDRACRPRRGLDGTVMVVWGGACSDTFCYLSTGGRYDPVTDTWTGTFDCGGSDRACRPRRGLDGKRDGALGWCLRRRNFVYLPHRRRTVRSGDGHLDGNVDCGAPSGRGNHTAIWTGSRMVVWGGNYLNTGGRYDPVMDAWTATSTVGAPSARSNHTAVWTGSLMVVWGGYGSGITHLNTGGRYDPVTDTWTATSTVGAPSARYLHTAVWTGSLVVVWGATAAI